VSKPISAQTATLANIASSASNVTLFAAVTGTIRARAIYNESTAVLFVKFGVTASPTSYTVQIPAGGYYEFPQPIYGGQVDGIWASANGSARVTSW